MLKGKTSQTTNILVALLTSTFLVAASEAQARRYHGTAASGVGKQQVIKSTKYKKSRYIRSKRYTHSTRSHRLRANFVARHGSVQPVSQSAMTGSMDPDSPYALQISLQKGGSLAQGERYSSRVPGASNGSVMSNAESMVGMTARGDRGELRRIFASTIKQAVDPARTPWCAAWANAVLAKSGIQGTGSLLARSFLSWGVRTTAPNKGDVAVLGRGRGGHVGFVVERKTVNGRSYVKLLGGNQGKQVKLSWFPESKVISYRKAS